MIETETELHPITLMLSSADGPVAMLGPPGVVTDVATTPDALATRDVASAGEIVAVVTLTDPGELLEPEELLGSEELLGLEELLESPSVRTSEPSTSGSISMNAMVGPATMSPRNRSTGSLFRG